MSLCDSNIEDKVKAHEDFLEIKCTRNNIKLLQVIKLYMYLNSSEELHTIKSCIESNCFGCNTSNTIYKCHMDPSTRGDTREVWVSDTGNHHNGYE